MFDGHKSGQVFNSETKIKVAKNNNKKSLSQRFKIFGGAGANRPVQKGNF